VEFIVEVREGLFIWHRIKKGATALETPVHTEATCYKRRYGGLVTKRTCGSAHKSYGDRSRSFKTIKSS
jgi:hypothetical protein